MYFFNLLKTIFRRANFAILIYLALNVFLVSFVIQFLLEIEFAQALLGGVLLYTISLFFALSPIGEWIVRLQTGCRRLQRQDDIRRITPLFNEVYSRAVARTPHLPRNIKLFISEDAVPNAFATGRKTICVTRGLLSLPDHQIKGILGHEFGHLAHKDTDLILLVSVGNLFVNIITIGIRLAIQVMYIFLYLIAILLDVVFSSAFETRNDNFALLLTHFSKFLVRAFVNSIIWIWTKIGTLLVMKSSRNNEFEADEYSFRLSVQYGNALCQFFDSHSGGGSSSGLFANLMSSHPDSSQRVAKLQQLGATYRRY